MSYFKKIVGERIYLSPLQEEDCDSFAKWLNNPAVSKGTGHYSHYISEKSEKDAVTDLIAKGHSYAIVSLEDDRLLGNIGFVNLDHINCTATVGIFVGEEPERGKGFGSEALRLIVDYGFHTLNLQNIMLLVHADNAPAIACYTKVGFREMGRRRQACYKNGSYVDVVYMDLLRTDGTDS